MSTHSQDTGARDARDGAPQNTAPGQATPQDFGIDCAALLVELYSYVDGGCDPDTRERLSHHLDACPQCLEQVGIEQQVRALLRTRCVEHAPQELRTRITEELRVHYVIRRQHRGD